MIASQRLAGASMARWLGERLTIGSVRERRRCTQAREVFPFVFRSDQPVQSDARHGVSVLIVDNRELRMPFRGPKHNRFDAVISSSHTWTMQFSPAGLIVLGVFVVLALIGGAWLPVAIVRIGAVVYIFAALIEIVVNMIRHRDFNVRSRLLGLFGGQSSFGLLGRARKP